MAFAVDESDTHLDFHKIPVIDLRFFSQDEINCAAQCSDEYTDQRSDDIVIPKIDRSIFNESAGSRKQTYSRLRFSQRREQLGSLTRRRAGLLSVSRHSVGVGISPGIRRKTVNASELKDNNQILQLLRELFMRGDGSSTCKNPVDQVQKDASSLQLSNPPLNSESGSNHTLHSPHNHDFNENVCNENRSLGREVRKCLQLVVRDSEIQNEGLNSSIQGMQTEGSNERVELEVCEASIPDMQMQSISSLDIDGNRAVVDDNLDRPKKKMRTKEDARRKAYAYAEEHIVPKLPGTMQVNTVEDSSHIDRKAAGTIDDKTVDDYSHTGRKEAGAIPDSTVDGCSHTERKLAKDNDGTNQNVTDVGDIWPYSTQEPFMPQLKRKFAPLETEAELHDFFNKIGGQWASKRKKRKIVDAEDFGEGFPKGWKLLLGVRKKDGRFLIECRKYISPDGQQLASCREVSAYVLSTLGHHSAVAPAQQTSGYSEYTQDYHKQAPSRPGNMMEHVDITGEGSKQYSPRINGSTFVQSEEQNFSQRNVSAETVGRVEESSSRKDHNLAIQNTPVKCSKCNINFSNRSTFMAHLTVHHAQKVKKTSVAKSIADGVIITNGKYECQICHKVFNERNRYTGHVGVHVRKSAKKLQDSSDQTSIASKADFSAYETFNDKFEEGTKVDAAVENLDTLVSDQKENNVNAIPRLIPGSSSPSGENDLASSHGEGLLNTLDTVSVKGEVEFSADNQKLENITGFGEFPMEYIQSPKFSFETGQDANSAIDAPIELGLDATVLQQEIDPPGQFEWDPVLSKMGSSSQLFVCVWCNTEFSHDGLDPDLQADSVGFMCPVCKSKISGQIDI